MDKAKKSPAQKVLGIVTTVLVVLFAIAAILLMGARVIGLRVYTIISGSMEPTYSVGDLIYVKSFPAEEIKVGDPITFVMNEDLVVATHRVVAIDAEKQNFYTQGDNNQVQDANPVHFKNLIGKPIFSIPYLGYVSDWVQSPPGMYIAIAVCVLLLGLVFIPDLFRGAKADELKKKEQELLLREQELELREKQADGSADQAEAATETATETESHPE